MPVFLESVMLLRSRWLLYINNHSFFPPLFSLLCECAQVAKEAGYKYFGLQFYGECWSGPGELRYNKYGKSKKCIDGNFRSKKCTSPNGNRCTGQEHANYVYQII